MVINHLLNGMILQVGNKFGNSWHCWIWSWLSDDVRFEAMTTKIIVKVTALFFIFAMSIGSTRKISVKKMTSIWYLKRIWIKTVSVRGSCFQYKNMTQAPCIMFLTPWNLAHKLNTQNGPYLKGITPFQGPSLWYIKFRRCSFKCPSFPSQRWQCQSCGQMALWRSQMDIYKRTPAYPGAYARHPPPNWKEILHKLLVGGLWYVPGSTLFSLWSSYTSWNYGWYKAAPEHVCHPKMNKQMTSRLKKKHSELLRARGIFWAWCDFLKWCETDQVFWGSLSYTSYK